jgi:hypothetical protein
MKYGLRTVVLSYGQMGTRFLNTRREKRQHIQTIREFLKVGADLEETFQHRSLHTIVVFKTSDHLTDVRSQIPSIWIVIDLLPAMNRNLVNGRFWKNYLCSVMDLRSGYSSIVEIISHCGLEMVREAFMH